MSHAEAAALGGRRRAERLSAERKKFIARLASAVRWGIISRRELRHAKERSMDELAKVLADALAGRRVERPRPEGESVVVSRRGGGHSTALRSTPRQGRCHTSTVARRSAPGFTIAPATKSTAKFTAEELARIQRVARACDAEFAEVFGEPLLERGPASIAGEDLVRFGHLALLDPRAMAGCARLFAHDQLDRQRPSAPAFRFRDFLRFVEELRVEAEIEEQVQRERLRRQSAG
jgi:hypothetical protein